MSLGTALTNAVSGLRTNQMAMGVLSNNMANVNTDGYSRKVVEQSAVYIEGVGNGVRIDDVVRKVDTYLQRSMMTQGSVNASAQVVTSYYDRLQVLLGAPGSQNSLDEYVTSYFNTLQQMADQPDRTSYRSNMVNSANTLATQVSSLAYEMESMRFQADSDINGAVTEINAALKKLYDLNAAIARAAAVGQSTAGLLDERDMALKTLADNMDITTFYEPNGTVKVTAGSGVPMVDGILHQLRYSPVASVENLVDDVRINAIEVVAIDINGNVSGVPQTLVSGGKMGEVQSKLSSGKLQGLVELRDKLIPDILNQLDMLASRLRDAMNGLHNNGSGWPPAQQLAGTRAVYGSQHYEWSGSVQIAVLSTSGQPAPSAYNNESYTGFRPLTLDLSAMRMPGGISGRSSIQAIVDEINWHFGTPTNKVEVGPINNIRLVSNTTQLPSGAPSLFNFDFELENISGDRADFFVSNVTVRDAGGAVLPGAYTQGPPSIALDPTATYVTYINESHVDVNLTSTAGLTVGEKIYLGAPGLANVNGIDAADLTGYFTIESITGNQIRINTNGVAGSSGSENDAVPAVATPSYAVSRPGEKDRTYKNGELQVDFTAALSSPYYEITVDMNVIDEFGAQSISQVTYRVQNNQQNLYSDRYHAVSTSGQGLLVQPNTTQAPLRAILVDANGNELPKFNGVYADQPGYLKIVGGNEDYVVSINELDSQHRGDVPYGVPATNWGFSHFFGLNNFFESNELNATGDSLKNSAINLAVQQRLRDNPNLVTSGRLQLQQQSSDPDMPPQYTYVRHSGDNSAVQGMAALAYVPLGFDAAGGLPTTALSLQGYTSEMLGYLASTSAAAQDTADNAQMLYEGFEERHKAISAVNLDEELAMTIILQNAYAANARIITVVNEMFDELVNTF